MTYTMPYGTLFPKKIKVGFIYTMNVPEERSREFGYEQIFNTNERYVNMLLALPRRCVPLTPARLTIIQRW
ncbi:MAG: hypothetical protein A2X82_13165 [Geobacteraceae bacterium GWC2_55_20]|nr:MAG: hypothetical protein A2X82_13165 [Geobacteraceae bacterium GWC2_55_20]HBA70794.1 hypothetical protein [Geobacter sp.]